MEYLGPVPPNLESAGKRAAAESIVRSLRKAGHAAFFAGGCVRDHLLGAPPKDWDIATSAPPDRIQSLFRRTQPVGAQFGVVLVLEGGAAFEVTTFRSEAGYADGRHPDAVAFAGGPEEDARRRDFTVNGLYLDPETGEVLDWVGGRADLEARVLRAIGDPDARFREDWLRMLRAPRFAAQLGFRIEPATAEAIRRSAARIAGVSAERVRDEVLKLLLAPGRRAGVEAMADLGLLPVVLPEVEALRGVRQPEAFHPEGDVLEHTLRMLEMADRPSETLALGIVLHDAGKPATFQVLDRIRFSHHARVGAEIAGRVCARLRLPNKQTERTVALVREHMKFMDIRRMRKSTLKRFLRIDGFEEHLELHRLDCLASHRKLDHWEYARARLTEFGQDGLRPAPLVNGHDLIAIGLPQGPLYARILKALEEEQLGGRILTREQALETARKMWEKERGTRLS
jgi:poly(A) polymerase